MANVETGRPTLMGRFDGHSRYGGSVRKLDSDEGRALLRFRDELVSQLFLKQGSFWDAVQDVRTRWDIKATVAIPPERAHLFAPEGISKPEDRQALQEWENELNGVVQREIPQRYIHEYLERAWKEFLSACMIYDPPETELLAFAEQCGLSPYGVVPPGVYYPPKPGESLLDDITHKLGGPFLLVMLAPPIRSLRDPDEARETERWFWERVIDEVGKRHLKPLGLDIRGLVKDVVDNATELTREYHERQRLNPPRDYILVDEHTTTRDIQRAVQLLAARRQEKPRGGASPRVPLVALQCAILYDRHNEKDPEDARRKKWTYESLSREFGLASARAAQDYVREGRKLLRADT
jgi:hypothetical protein